MRGHFGLSGLLTLDFPYVIARYVYFRFSGEVLLLSRHNQGADFPGGAECGLCGVAHIIAAGGSSSLKNLRFSNTGSPALPVYSQFSGSYLRAEPAEYHTYL